MGLFSIWTNKDSVVYKIEQNPNGYEIFSYVTRIDITGESETFINSCGSFTTEEEANKALQTLQNLLLWN